MISQPWFSWTDCLNIWTNDLLFFRKTTLFILIDQKKILSYQRFHNTITYNYFFFYKIHKNQKRWLVFAYSSPNSVKYSIFCIWQNLTIPLYFSHLKYFVANCKYFQWTFAKIRQKCGHQDRNNAILEKNFIRPCS